MMRRSKKRTLGCNLSLSGMYESQYCLRPKRTSKLMIPFFALNYPNLDLWFLFRPQIEQQRR